MKASVCHLGYSRSSGLEPGRVVVVTSSFSDSIVFAVNTWKTVFSNTIVFKYLQLKSFIVHCVVKFDARRCVFQPRVRLFEGGLDLTKVQAKL